MVQLRNFSRLRTLNLNPNMINITGMKHLRQLKSLKDLSVGSTHVSVEATHSLRQVTNPLLTVSF